MEEPLKMRRAKPLILRSKRTPLASLWGILCSLILSLAQECQADDWNAEMNFLAGYHDYLNTDYLACSTHFLAALEEEVEAESRARLYLSFCQMKLGYTDAATYHYLQLNPKELSKVDEAILQTVKARLKKKIQEAQQFHASLALYTGGINYQSVGRGATPVNTSSLRGYGLYSFFQKERWSFTLSGMNLGTAASQGLIGLQRTYGQSWTLWTKGFLFQGNSNSPQRALGGGVGAQWSPSRSLQFKLNYFYSAFPSLGLSPLAVSQTTGAWRWNFYRSPTQLLGLELGYQALLPTAATTTDPSTGYSLSPFYQRPYAQLFAQSRYFSLNIGGWSGREILGIRNEGNLLFSTLTSSNPLEEHRYGWNIQLDFTPQPLWGIEATFIQEHIQIMQSEVDTRSLFLGLFLNL